MVLNPPLSQESQKIFKAEHPMENTEATKTKLIGYGFQLLEGRGWMTRTRMMMPPVLILLMT